MNIGLILESAKTEMTTIISALTIENIENKRSEIEKYFTFIESLSHLPQIKSLSIDEIDDEKKIKPITTNKVSMEEKEKNHLGKEKIGDNSKIGNEYIFERKLKGGFLPDLDGGYFIPEKMVRDMQVEHKDKIKIISETPGYPKTLYRFELVEKGNQIDADRVQHYFCKVEKEAGELTICDSQSGTIKLDEIPYTFIVSQNDKDKYHLQKGDIVDIAYYKENPNGTMKVIFKYDLVEEASPLMTTEYRKLVSTERLEKKKNSIDRKTPKEYPLSTHMLKNKSVLVVGGMKRHKDYKEAFESIGAEFYALTGDEGHERMSAVVSKADIVAISIGECSHAASIFTVETCKQRGIPFSSTHRSGIQSILFCAEAAIRKGTEVKEIEYTNH
ncbi:DUF2325 domain-containing protein [Metabacillus herbersteinensis]|uniref:DUF2325 domain-containing protein n=1 Tax=Metabacillus herbersteinensis TaxID=283816 RepID=A0ABV6GIW4_9BACI